MVVPMSPVQTAKDILTTIPNVLNCCSNGRMDVPVATMAALRQAIDNAADEEECVCRLLARCRGVVRQHVIRCQVQADVEAAESGRMHARSEEALNGARELLCAIEARLGVDRD